MYDPFKCYIDFLIVENEVAKNKNKIDNVIVLKTFIEVSTLNGAIMQTV